MAAEPAAPPRPAVRTSDASAVFGRWVAELLADAWRNGWRPSGGARTNEGRASHRDARPSETGREEKRGVTSTGHPAPIVHD